MTYEIVVQIFSGQIIKVIRIKTTCWPLTPTDSSDNYFVEFAPDLVTPRSTMTVNY